MYWKHGACLFALIAVLQLTQVNALLAPQEDVLTGMAVSIPALIGFGWNDSDATLGCSWPGVVCDGSEENVEQLHLDGWALDNSFPGDLSALTNLQNLTAEGCGLTGNLPILPGSLQILILSNNSMDGTLSGLSTLSSLETLKLDQNGFSDVLPSFSSFGALTVLNLAQNALSLCGADPELPALSVCDISAQTTSPCACSMFYSSCVVDVCSPVEEPSAAPVTSPETGVPVGVPVDSPVEAPMGVPASEPTAPVSAPQTVPVQGPTTAPEDAPLAPVESPVMAPEEEIGAPTSEPVEMVPGEETPSEGEEPQSELPPDGQLLPLGVCADVSVLSLTLPNPASFILSYWSNLTEPWTIPHGPYNQISAGSVPTTFYPGTHSMVVRVDSTVLSSVKWNLNNYAVSMAIQVPSFAGVCPPVPSLWSMFEFSGTLLDTAVAEDAIQDYLYGILLTAAPTTAINSSRLVIQVTDTSSRRAPSFTANITIINDLIPISTLGDVSVSISSFGLMQRILANLTEPLEQDRFVSCITNAGAIASGASFLQLAESSPLPVINAVYEPASNAPSDDPSRPYSYYVLSTPQKVGVAIAVIFGLAMLAAVILGLWHVSKPARSSNSTLSVTRTNGRTASGSPDSHGNTSKDTDIMDNDPQDDTDDETDDETGEEDEEESTQEEESEEEESEEEEEDSQEEESEEDEDDTEESD